MANFLQLYYLNNGKTWEFTITEIAKMKWLYVIWDQLLPHLAHYGQNLSLYLIDSVLK